MLYIKTARLFFINTIVYKTKYYASAEGYVAHSCARRFFYLQTVTTSGSAQTHMIGLVIANAAHILSWPYSLSIGCITNHVFKCFHQKSIIIQVYC